jgi:hypothetical protein
MDNEKDLFYSKENMNYLKNVISKIDSGKAKLHVHELIEDEIDNAIEEAENEFSMTKESIDAKTAFDLLEKKYISSTPNKG